MLQVNKKVHMNNKCEDDDDDGDDVLFPRVKSKKECRHRIQVPHDP